MNTTTARKLERFFKALSLVGAVASARAYQDAQRAASTLRTPDRDAVARVASTGRCCDKATVRACVCRVATDCPDHGAICVGSHE